MTNEELNEIKQEQQEMQAETALDEKSDVSTKKGFFRSKSKTDDVDKKIRKSKRKKLTGAVTVCALILAVGVVGNWYYENSDVSSTIQPLIDTATEKTLGKAELVDAKTNEKVENKYFSSARVDRQNARDSSLETLQDIINSSESTEDAKKDATKRITAISSYITIENKIETLVCAKGVSNCIAVVNDDGTRVDVIVDVAELNDTLIMQIKDIAIAQLGCSFENVSIIQSNNK